VKKESKAALGITLCALLLIGLAFLLRARPGAAAGARVDIHVHNALYASLPFPPADGTERLRVEHADGGWNEIVVDAAGVYMHAANCPGQDCVGQGRVGPDNHETRPLGAYILCLPHKLAVEFVAKEE